MSAVFDVGHSKTRMYSTNEDDSLKINIDDFGLTDELTLSVDVRKISSECNFTQEDYELFKERYIVSSDDGYLSIDYGFLENYWDSVSSYIANISDVFKIIHRSKLIHMSIISSSTMETNIQ